MKTKILSMVALTAFSMAINAQVSISLDPAQRDVKVSPDLYGIFFEDINHAADGGLYAELIRNRSFEDSEKNPDFWSTEGKASAVLIHKGLLNKVQKTALEVTFKGEGGIANQGFWGIDAVQGRIYKLSFWAKGWLAKGGLTAVLTNKDGSRIYSKVSVEGKLTRKWQKYTAELTSNANDSLAQLRLLADSKGVVDFDVVSLFPPTFKNRPNGMRPDLAQMLYNLHPKFMRFPGGCFVEGQDSPENAFHWERTVGPIEDRPGHQNVNWHYRTSDGMGFHEYLQLAEDLGAKPLYVVNVGLWHGGKTPIDSIQPWIDECMNALEYANGPVTSKYGALRARNGHPSPFNIQYLEIGNENNQPDPAQQSDHYYDRFKKFKDAILSKYPNMHLIGNVAAWGTDNPRWGSEERADLLDEHYYRSPAWFADEFHKYDRYSREGSHIYVGEYAVTQGFGKDGNLNAALGEAVYMMGLENNSDVVSMASYAPIFANVNNRMWSPDMIQFDGKSAFGTPSYYVQEMMANNIGTQVLKVEMNNPYKVSELEKVSPDISQMGVATWNTQASFQFAGLEEQGKNSADILPGAMTFSDSDWKENNGILSQTSEKEGCMAIDSYKVMSHNYTLHLRARKDGGREGFIIVFNYVDPDNYCWLNLGGWGNTQHAIEQVVNGAKSQIALTSGSVEQGKWYNVDLTIHGDSIYASFGGQQIFATRLKPNTTPSVFSSATYDEKTGDVILKVANTGKEATTADVDVKNMNMTSARVIRLVSAKGTNENNLTDPTHIVPTEEELSPEKNKLVFTVPAYSLNIVRMK
jgi:alpha-L-arabinofuranosidase